MIGSRFKLNQNHAPIHEALETFRRMRVVPFDVPGHKRGRGNPELTEFLGQKCVGVDVNSMKPLDNLCHPVSVIREAEELAADAFGAAHAFLMVGGTTSSVQTMVLTACKRGDEIILPRNVHRSVLNALVLCGAIPVYVNPEVDQRLGISLGMRREQVEKAIKEHPKAVAVLVNNPTYYGICSDLRAIVKMPMTQECCVWQMKHMEPIFILAAGFRFLPWQQVQTWHLYPCIRAEEVLHSQVFSLQARGYTQAMCARSLT